MIKVILAHMVREVPKVNVDVLVFLALLELLVSRVCPVHQALLVCPALTGVTELTYVYKKLIYEMLLNLILLLL